MKVTITYSIDNSGNVVASANYNLWHHFGVGATAKTAKAVLVQKIKAQLALPKDETVTIENKGGK